MNKQYKLTDYFSLFGFFAFLKIIGTKDKTDRANKGPIISGLNNMFKSGVVPCSKYTPSPLPNEQKTAVPGIIPKNVPVTNVRIDTPNKAGAKLTNQKGNTGTKRNTSKYDNSFF